MLHRVEEIALQRKHGPSINGRGDTESELLLVSPLSEIRKNDNESWEKSIELTNNVAF